MTEEQKWLQEKLKGEFWSEYDCSRAADDLAPHLAEREREMRETIADLRRMVEIAHNAESGWKTNFNKQVEYMGLYAKHFPAPRPEPKYMVGKFYVYCDNRVAYKVTDLRWNADHWEYNIGDSWLFESDLRPLREDER